MHASYSLTAQESSSRNRLPESHGSISASKIRRNEGDNLYRDKVQRLIGGCLEGPSQAPRSNEPKVGISSDANLTDDCDMNGSSPPGNVVNLCARGPSRATLQNDFSIGSLDSDLEFGILSTSPLGCSTPRIIGSTAPGSISTNSLRCSPGMSLSTGQESTPTSGSQLALHTCHVRGSSPVGDKRLHVPAAPTRKASANREVKVSSCNTDLVPVQHNGAKKHPSPSKEVLENLEIALHKVARLDVCDARMDEMDELSANEGQHRLLLQARNPNVMLKRLRTGGIKSEAYASGNGEVGHDSDASSSRQPRPAQTQCARLPRPGAVMMRRMVLGGADDTDELQ